MAIQAVFIVNNTGKPRLTKFYIPLAPHARAAAVQHVFDLISGRPDSVCNFVELPPGGLFGAADSKGKSREADRADLGETLRVIYRHYATLYFALVVDEAESELGILDLIQVFVESLDRCFENVCELDLIFHFDEVHTLLSCMIVGGLVADTSIDSIAASFRAAKVATRTSATGSLAASFADVGGGSGWDKLGFGTLRRS